MHRTIEEEDYYIIYSYGKIEEPRLKTPIEEYTSNNTYKLSEDEIFNLLKKKSG